VTDRKIALARLGGRTAAGVAGLAATAAVLGAVFTLPLSTAHAQPASRVVRPVPATATVACPGPLLTMSSDSAATQLSPEGKPNVISGGSEQSPASVPLSVQDVSGAHPAAFHTPASDGHEPLLAGATSLAVDTSELRGLAAANCASPGFDEWLVGGATSLGQTTLVVLSNPGDVAATVKIDSYFEQGLAAGAGGNGVLVQPHTQRVVPLSGLVPNASATIVHVTSTGGTVSAELQQAAISGVTPQGADWAGPAAAPAKRLVVPGVVVAGAASGAADSDDAGVPALRVMPVGDKDAKLSIGARPESGSAGGQAVSVTVSHGMVSEVPLDKLGKGTFTVTVDSSAPVVAAVRSSATDAKAGTDFAWYAAADRLTGAAAIPIAPGPNGYLHLVNTSDSAVTLKLDGPGGGQVSVPAGASASRPISSRGVLTTGDAHGLYVGVGYSGAGQLASYVAYPTSASEAALKVYKR
jgi:hypothetical protein